MGKLIYFLIILPILAFLALVPTLYYIWAHYREEDPTEFWGVKHSDRKNDTKSAFDDFLHFDPKSWQNYISGGLDQNQDACSSFYKFVCNKWVGHNFPGLANLERSRKGIQDFRNFSHLPYTSEFQKALKLFDHGVLKSIKTLDLVENSSSLTFYEKSVRNFYNQCSRPQENLVDVSTDNNTHWPMYGILEKLTGRRLPFFDNETEREKNIIDIWKMAAEFHGKFRTDFIFRISIVRLNRECKKKAVLLIAPLTDWYETKSERNSIIKRLSDIAAYQNLSSNSENFNETLQIEVIIDELSKFRREMKKLFDLHGRTERKVRFSDLDVISPSVPWRKYFKELLPRDLLQKWNLGDPGVILKGENYFRHLGSVLSRFEQKVVQNFASVQLMKNYLKSVKYKLEPRKIGEHFDSVEQKCLDLTLKYFSSATLRIYLERFLGMKNRIHEWRYDLEAMMQSILSSLRFSLAGVDWLGRRDRALLIKKVNNINFYPGIPDWLTDDEILRIRTPEVQDSLDVDIHETSLRMDRDFFIKDAWELVESTNSGSAAEDPEPNFEIDATYRMLTVSIGTGFVLPPLYHIDYPASIKFGTLGWILAHELMHAFDDAHINERPPGIDENDWLSKETLKDFQSKKHCIMKQFSKYCYRDTSFCIRGKKTVNDNLADVEGLKLAYLAYKLASQQLVPPTTSTSTPNFVSNSTESVGNSSSHGFSSSGPPLQGTGTGGERQFLLAAGRMWCGVGSEMDLRYFWDDVHAPRMARVDVSMKNFATFALSFRCPVGAPLAPTRLCSIWAEDVDVSS